MDKLERGEKNERYDKSYNTYDFISCSICWIYYLWVIQKPSNRKWKNGINLSIWRRFMILRQKEKDLNPGRQKVPCFIKSTYIITHYCDIRKCFYG